MELVQGARAGLIPMFKRSEQDVPTVQQIFTEWHLCACAVILVVSGAVSSMTTQGVKVYAIFASFFMLIGGGFLIIILPMLAPKLQSAEFVFGQFFSWQAADLGIPSSTCATISKPDLHLLSRETDRLFCAQCSSAETRDIDAEL